MMTRQEAFADTVVAYDDADDGSLLLVLSAERFYGSLSDPDGRMIPPAAGGNRAPSSVIPIARSA